MESENCYMQYARLRGDGSGGIWLYVRLTRDYGWRKSKSSMPSWEIMYDEENGRMHASQVIKYEESDHVHDLYMIIA